MTAHRIDSLHDFIADGFKTSPAWSVKVEGQDFHAARAARESGRSSRRSGESTTHHLIGTVDEATGIEVTCDATEFTADGAVDWVLRLENLAMQGSALVEDLYPLDIIVPLPAGCRSFGLHSARGGVCTEADYEPVYMDLPPSHSAKLHAAGGRSSNHHLPFFNLVAGTEGIAVGIGWSGQWAAHFETDESGALRIRIGMEHLHLQLRSGERIRSPRILLVGWKGDRLTGHNRLRQTIYRHYTPLLNGAKPLPPIQCNTWFPVGSDGGNANEENQKALIHAYGELGVDYVVMDAGWYGESPIWHRNVGTWLPRADTFPNGLEPLGEAAGSAGVQLGLWFEPERVCPSTALDREHPEWLITISEDADRLLHLGKPDVQRWFIDTISDHIEGLPLGYFRHDFNIDPLPYWQHADSPDRIGMTEIQYVQGLYRILSDLHARFPWVMMEGCASGGRRIDLESLSRCHTYWKTDLYGNELANQAHAYGANLFIPANYLNTPLLRATPDAYAFRSQLGGALCVGLDPEAADFDAEWVRRHVAEYRELRPLLVGDFHPLTAYSRSPDEWLAYQFHRRDLDQGLVLAFRREAANEASLEVRLQGLDAETEYELVFRDRGDTRTGRGAALMEPLHLAVPTQPGSALVTYRALGKDSTANTTS